MILFSVLACLVPRLATGLIVDSVLLDGVLWMAYCRVLS
jgi:hypothetical protein